MRASALEKVVISMNIYDDVRNGNVSVFDGAQVNLKDCRICRILCDLQSCWQRQLWSSGTCGMSPAPFRP